MQPIKYLVVFGTELGCQKQLRKQERMNKIMDDNRQEQIEALEVMAEFNERVLKNMRILIKELSGARLDDTNKFIQSIVDAMNWEIEVMNGTMTLLNEGKERINKEDFNAHVVAVANAINAKDDAMMAEAFTNVLPYFEKLGEAAKEVLA